VSTVSTWLKCRDSCQCVCVYVCVCVAYSGNLSSSAVDQQLLAAAGGAVSTALSSSAAGVSHGSVRDLLGAPMITRLEDVSVQQPVSRPAAAAPSLPTYDMAVAASNRRTQQQPAPMTSLMTSEPPGMMMTHQTHLLTGGNTLVMVPTQVR